MYVDNEESAIAMMRDGLLAARLGDHLWTFNEYEDGCHYLVLSGGRWVAGFFEKGRLDERFSEADPNLALARFIDWVRATETSTQASAKATERWLKRTGQSRP